MPVARNQTKPAAQQSPVPHTLRKDNLDKSIMNSLHTGGSGRLRFNWRGLNLGHIAGGSSWFATWF
jgi:hypothetical protein